MLKICTLPYLTFLLRLTVVKLQSHFSRLDCRSQWTSHDQCMKNREYRYEKTVPLTSQDRLNMKSEMRRCYLNEKCADPFASNYMDSIRKYCYNRYKYNLKSTMQQCVSKNFPDYTIPDENDVSVDVGQDMLNVRDSACVPEYKDRFGKCMVKARGDKGKNNFFANADYCKVRFDCYNQVGYSQTCYDRSAQLRARMCQCGKSLNISDFSQIYRSCLKQMRQPAKNESEDYNFLLLKQFTDTRYCINYADSCGGFRGQEKTVASGATIVPPKVVVAPSGNVVITKLPVSNDVTKNGGLDFGSLLTSGGLFPDPREVIANAGFGSMTSGGLGALPSGFDLMSLFSQAFNMSDAMAQLSGLFSGASLFGGFGGGNPFDLSSWFRGFNQQGFGNPSIFGQQKATTEASTSALTTQALP